MGPAPDPAFGAPAGPRGSSRTKNPATGLRPDQDNSQALDIGAAAKLALSQLPVMPPWSGPGGAIGGATTEQA
jgi:hypothetical protein